MSVPCPSVLRKVRSAQNDEGDVIGSDREGDGGIYMCVWRKYAQSSVRFRIKGGEGRDAAADDMNNFLLRDEKVLNGESVTKEKTNEMDCDI
jgi:hypothetical protein